MMPYRNKSIILTILFIMVSCLCFAQTPEGAKKQMSLGNYSNAVKLYSALNELYPGSFKSELSNAKKCLSLSNSAQKSFKADRYTEAIGYYNQILKLNPLDQSINDKIQKCETARDAFLDKEFYNCKSISDYKSFSQKYPNSKQGISAAKIVSDHELLAQDEDSWKLADGHGRGGTIDSYTQYLKTANTQAKHKKEAFRNRARLYYQQQEYSKALNDYSMAKQLKCYFWMEDEANYVICAAETKYAALGQFPSSTQVSDYLKWANNYSEDVNKVPHLHINEANGLLVKIYCQQGWFSLAKNHVDECFPNISPASITINESTYWKKKDWYTYIKQSEKQFKRTKSNSQQNSNRGQGIDLMGGVGISYNPSGFNMDSFLGFNASFSIGSFENRFNWEFAISPNIRITHESCEADNIKFLCPITTGPRLNIVRARGGGFFLSMEPEVGYCIGGSGIYGGKVMLGYSIVGLSFEYLRNMQVLSAGTKWESNSLFGGIGLNIYF